MPASMIVRLTVAAATGPRGRLTQTVVGHWQSGEFKDFPHYNTAHPSLEPRQINLLVQLNAWVMMEHAAELRATLG